MNIRIAFVVGDLRFGGATTFLLHLARGLTAEGVQIQIHCLEKDDFYLAEFEKLEVSIFTPPADALIFEDRIADMCLKLADFRPTAVIGWLGPASYEALRYVPQGVLRMAVIHCDDEIFYKALIPYTPVLDGVVAYSRAMIRALSAMGEFSMLRVYYLPNAVPIPHEIPLSGRSPTEPLRILYLGRLENGQKRVRLFPQILKGLTESGIPFLWTIAGKGPERKFLEENLKTESAHQQVVFAGDVPYDQVPGLLLKHDILLLASHTEGLPLSLLEAMGQGVVPVISDIESGVRDVVDATNGMLVPIDDIEGYARAIIWLHEHRDALQKMRLAAHAKVLADHSVETMTREWLDCLQSREPKEISWPRSFRIYPPKALERRFLFRPFLRPLRRIFKKTLPTR